MTCETWKLDAGYCVTHYRSLYKCKQAEVPKMPQSKRYDFLDMLEVYLIGIVVGIGITLAALALWSST